MAAAYILGQAIVDTWGNLGAIWGSMASYTSKELSLKLGLPERTVSIWAEKQFLCPSIEDATGRGSMRIWSENDFRQGELLVRLMPILRPELIREIAKQFKNE